MKKWILKICSLIMGIGILFFLFQIGGLPLMEGYNSLDPYADTEFAKDYTPAKFNHIQQGMHLLNVKKILGEPLFIDTDTNYQKVLIIVYTYTNDGYLQRRTDKKYALVNDLAWYRSYVEFNANDSLVSYVNAGWSYD